MSENLLQSTHMYVLLGEFTTGYLEEKFGGIRQGAGGSIFYNSPKHFRKAAH